MVVGSDDSAAPGPEHFSSAPYVGDVITIDCRSRTEARVAMLAASRGSAKITRLNECPSVTIASSGTAPTVKYSHTQLSQFPVTPGVFLWVFMASYGVVYEAKIF
jgi:hypothetical protein